MQIEPYSSPLPPGPPQPIPLTYYASYSKEEPDELNLKRLLTVLKRRAWIVLGVTAAVTGSIWAWTLTQVPMYQAEFRVLVEPATKQTQNPDDQLLQSGAREALLSEYDYETQIEVLKSPELLAPIAARIQKFYPEVNYSSLLESLNLFRLRDTKIIVVTYRDRDPDKIQKVLDQLSQDYLRYSFLQRQTSVQQGTKFVEDQLPQLRQRVNSLQAELEKFRQRYSLIDPESRGSELSERISNIEQQYKETQTQLQEAQARYQLLEKQSGYKPGQALVSSALSESPRYQKLLDQIREVETQISVESARFQPDSPNIQALQEKRKNLLPLLQQESQRILGNASSQPANGNLAPIFLDLSKQLITTTNEVQTLKVREQALSTAAKQLRQEFELVPAIARQYTDLQRELTIATESLNRFLATRESLQLEAAKKAIPWQLLAPPVKPLLPFSPNVPRNLSIGIVAGLLLGIGSALLAEKLDNVFHSANDLKDTTHLPLLGIIPFRKATPEIAVPATPSASLPGNNVPRPGHATLALAESLEAAQDPEVVEAVSLTITPQNSYNSRNTNPFLESFRSLYTNIRLLSSDSPIRSIVVSSAVPADGKTTVSVQLARAAAALGQRVLLVDADLRRPQVYVSLGLSNMRGLSNLISTDLPLEDALQSAPEDENLWILPAGQIPPDPTKLLSSQKMQNLMKQLKEKFDFVIYDTPPLLGLADSTILAPHTDGMLTVVGLGRTDRSVLTQTLDNLKTSSIPVLGIVANGVKDYTTGDYYYSYYYHRYYADSAPNPTGTYFIAEEDSPATQTQASQNPFDQDDL